MINNMKTFLLLQVLILTTTAPQTLGQHALRGNQRIPTRIFSVQNKKTKSNKTTCHQSATASTTYPESKDMTTLFLIDLQNDFHPGGALAIPSADADAERTASYIKRNALSIDRIVATLDSHHKLNIALPAFWTDANGDRPAPFTVISNQDIINGKWIPRSDLKFPPMEMPLIEQDVIGDSFASLFKANGDIDTLAWSIEYTKRLEENGRDQLHIWPEHCIIGTPGHNVVACVRDALDEWSDKTGRSVEWIEKGQNLLTEMYSALSAEVPVDAMTSFDNTLLDSLKQSKQLIVCGQALSHCVNHTVRDIVKNWPKDETGKMFLGSKRHPKSSFLT